jgi:phage virion morphogenesis protein
MITIDIEDDEIRAALAGALAQLENPAPLMAQIGEALLVSTRERFARGVDPDGSAWAQRSQATLDRYAAMKPPRRPGPKPLTLSGYLQRSLFPFSAPDHAGIGAPAIYAAAMQFGAARGAFGSTARGAPIPWGAIPARPFLGLSAKDRQTILDLVAEALEAATGSATA